VGLVVFTDLTVADCGGGAQQHVIYTADYGAGAEMAFVVDGRPRGAGTPATAMAGGLCACTCRFGADGVRVLVSGF
jgi:hypothetical protein